MDVPGNRPMMAVIFLAAIAAGFAAGRTTALLAPIVPRHQEDIALRAFREGDSRDALPIFLKLAQNGDTKAAYYLGEMYEFGDGTPVNGGEAIHWLSEAARAGNVAAARQLGTLYLDGTATIQDYGKARHWLEVAARGQDTTALVRLGDMSDKGLGREADPAAAYGYYAAAAARGNAYGLAMRDRIAPGLTPAQQSAGEKLAMDYQESAAKHESGPAGSAKPGTKG
ncbi:hypothetical protein CSC94_10435 [Zhengella mangrovi]|uniref:Sel1 repeat family protein n=1 Tax=Zhengella mangrovi TaxID=1982044 RepID=A0A2G1QN41_9HYPH|nr:SEL1-like repeat protein [Zhengella mangrovi]PHP66967.1 hypothetical protein CSC94_10435 [Zhengella mangrovi]